MAEHRPEQGARRSLRTILAGDVVGYSRHMGEAEEDTLAALARHRTVIDALIARHHGLIFTTAGDSVLASFESPAEAVRCALSIQADIRDLHRDPSLPRRLTFRIGVHAGDILVSGRTLLGDTVNVAARLEAAATPGAILISQDVHGLLDPSLADRFLFQGRRALKDLPQPVITYEGGGDPTARAQRPARRRVLWTGPLIVAVLGILAYLFAVYDGIAFWTAGIGYRLAPADFVLPLLPPTGSLTPGQTVLVDDGTCPPGQIRQISGGNMTLRLPRGDHCIGRP